MFKKDMTENSNLKTFLRELREQIIFVPDFTEDELREVVKYMRPKMAPGTDDISIILLKISFQCNQIPSSHVQYFPYD